MDTLSCASTFTLVADQCQLVAKLLVGDLKRGKIKQHGGTTGTWNSTSGHLKVYEVGASDVKALKVCQPSTLF